MWESIRATGRWSGEIWNKRKNGEVFPEMLAITAVKDDLQKTTHYIGTFTDITVRKQLEESLIESEDRFRSLIENAPICIQEIDLSGKISSMNKMSVKTMSTIVG
jgi:PAS domain-containing protein